MENIIKENEQTFDEKFLPRCIKDIKAGDSMVLPIELFEFIDTNEAYKDFLRQSQLRLVAEHERRWKELREEIDKFRKEIQTLADESSSIQERWAYEKVLKILK